MNHQVQPNQDTGASAVEYGLLVSAIAGIIALIVFALGVVTQETYQDTCDALTNGSTTITGPC